MSKPTSAKQIAANRRNAVKSTGPRTPQGRAVSRINALKHGILSRQVLVRSRVLQESETDLEALHLRFRENLQPEGPVEEMLVDQIVSAHWRLRRALAAESGEIALRLDWRHRRRERCKLAIQSLEWEEWQDRVDGMEGDTRGNMFLIVWLEAVRDAVVAEGALTKAAVQEFAARFLGKSNRLVRELDDLRKKHQEGPGDMDDAEREKQKAAALAFLDLRIRLCRSKWERCKEEEVTEEHAERAIDLVPPSDVLDSILRYETKLERQMFRAMTHLERLQRMRGGEAIPAPLSVEVSERE